MAFRSNILVGYGKSHGSFGELIQGRLPGGRDFLVTLPVDMWSICNLTAIERQGPLVINCEYSKSRRVVEMLLEKLGVEEGFEVTISFSRNIPVGKGLSSSTADMLSTVRALQEVFGCLLREKTISEMFTKIEPHDGLMFKSCVVYDHRKGELIKELLYIPEFSVVAVDLGGEVDTLTYNKDLQFTPDVMAEYDALLEAMAVDFERRDDQGIADKATRSAELHLRARPDLHRRDILDHYRELGAMGVVNTHSGTCLGLLYPRSTSTGELDAIAQRVKSRFGHSVFLTHTLRLLI
ncbi:MAG: hypothetical protein IPO17_10975 [Flavobacteriales bacterium]|nr:hypothetical protein [Flavobacteriales bacterium]